MVDRFKEIAEGAETFAALIIQHTKPGRSQDAALEHLRKAVDKANRNVLVDRITPKRAKEN